MKLYPMNNMKALPKYQITLKTDTFTFGIILILPFNVMTTWESACFEIEVNDTR